MAMVCLLPVLLSFILLASTAWASPLPVDERLRFPNIDPKEILCQLPIVKKILCPRTGTDQSNVQTALGVARGTADPSGAYRFVVRYAQADRWARSSVVTNWNLPTGSSNASTLPLACPQPGVDPSSYTEDCLSMVIYVPPNLAPRSGVSTLLWIHGGSFIVGSATGPGLDGSKLAIATNSIVAVAQYRLGALGFLAPDGTTNLAVQDIMNAMKFLKQVVPSFGGNNAKITLAGQSSGANMIRALLATPSASSLFTSAILQSDPMNFGFLSPSAQQAMQSEFNALTNCSSNDKPCWNGLSLETILNSQMNIFANSIDIDPSTGNAQPIRPVHDGALITSPLDSTAPFPNVSKPLLISTVLNEAGFAIYSQFPDPLPGDAYGFILQATFGTNRTNVILASPYYPEIGSVDGSVDARPQLQSVGTDYLWKCSSWTFARNWVQNGGRAYVGQYVVGASYPGNDATPYCLQYGNVCHQDDIQIVFGTVSNPTSAQNALIAEMQQRYKAFLATGDPNAPGVRSWSAATSSNVNAIQLGGSGLTPIDACDPAFWGQSVQYDYQYYGI